MGQLGDVLELAATSRQRWTSVRAELELFSHAALQQLAVQRAQPEFVPRRSSPPGDPWEARRAQRPPELSAAATLWARGPSQVRVEAHADHAEPWLNVLLVRHDGSQWVRQASGDVMVVDLGQPFSAVSDTDGWTTVLEPDRLIEGCDVQALGPGRIAGRPTLGLRLRPRSPSTSGPGRTAPLMFLGWIGDEATVDLDARTGIVMRLECRVDGKVMRLLTISALMVDPPLDEGLFTEEPPPQAQVVPATGTPEPAEQIAAQVSFPVLVPASGDCDAFHTEAAGSEPELVHVMARAGRLDPDGWLTLVTLVESPSPAGVADTADWERVQLADGPGWIWEPMGGGEVHVRLDRMGTHIWVRGLYDRNEALELAGSLVPARPA